MYQGDISSPGGSWECIWILRTIQELKFKRISDIRKIINYSASSSVDIELLDTINAIKFALVVALKKYSSLMNANIGTQKNVSTILWDTSSKKRVALLTVILSLFLRTIKY